MGNPFTTTNSSSSLTTVVGLTSAEEIERVYSTIGVSLRLDDLSTEEQVTAMNEIILAASGTVESYTLKYYDTNALMNSPWIRRRATIIGAYYLSMRRANGTQFAMEYQRVIEDLEKFLSGNPPMIPNNDGFPVPVRASNIPTVSKYKIDDRYRRSKLRVDPHYSTKPYPGRLDYWDGLSGDGW